MLPSGPVVRSAVISGGMSTGGASVQWGVS